MRLKWFGSFKTKSAKAGCSACSNPGKCVIIVLSFCDVAGKLAAKTATRPPSVPVDLAVDLTKFRVSEVLGVCAMAEKN